MLKIFARFLAVACALALAACATQDSEHLVRISIPDQKMMVLHKGVTVASYDVSTSRFGVGDRPGSFATPLGRMEIARKIGEGEPSGMKFHGRRPTGEIVRPNTPGRDPIVSRILWLRGLESQNYLAYSRAIYIHGTTEEAKIGTPASYGCIRMRSRDVIALYDLVGVGAKVEVTMNSLPKPEEEEHPAVANTPAKPAPAATPAPAAAGNSAPHSPAVAATPPPRQS